MTVELWSTERIRQELGAKTIRSAGRIILRLGLVPVAREPGRSGMNLYDATEAGEKIAEHLGRRKARGQPGADPRADLDLPTLNDTPRPTGGNRA